jgi:hypothetical protein
MGKEGGHGGSFLNLLLESNNNFIGIRKRNGKMM